MFSLFSRRSSPAPVRYARLGFESMEARYMPTCSCLTPLAGTLPETDSAGQVAPRIVNGQPTSAFPSVGIVGDTSGDGCTGTLISSRYVLTAGHCAEGLTATQGRFTIGGVKYSTSRIFVHPNYNGNLIGSDSANDLAIFELSQPVQGITPSPLYRQSPVVGQLLTLVGFGAGGTGSSGHNGDFGIKRVGTTPIDGVSSRLITWSFDNNSESNTAPGDSGGPAFILANGFYYLAGVTSGGDRADAGLGDNSFDTRVDAYAGWIDSIIGSSTPTPTPPGDDHGDTLARATSLSLDAMNRGVASGVIGSATDRDVFRFTARVSGIIQIDVRAVGGDLDTVLRVFDSQGRRIAFNDDYGQGLDSRVRIQVTRGAVYYLQVTGYDGSQGNYRVNIAPSSIFAMNRGGRAASVDWIFSEIERRRDHWSF